MTEPGLVSRTVTPIGDSAVEVHETWDLRVPGCAQIIMQVHPDFQRHLDAVSLERKFEMPIEHWHGWKK